MTFELRFTVHGLPAPKGSAVHGFGGTIRVRTDKVIAWESCVSHAAVIAMQRAKHLKPWKGALKAHVVFRMPRPEGHYEKQDKFTMLRPPSIETLRLKRDAPIHVSKAPDLDKLQRSTFDAMNKLVYMDDGQIAEIRARKRYVDIGEQPGADISIESYGARP
jgi:Holliday junction resolvase RusA-like endonuclease